MFKILVADDEENILNLYKIRLTHKGFDVITACDGEDALNKLRTSNVDLLILDIMMPKITGYELVEILRDNDINTPVILVTAKGELNDKIKGFEYGADDYLVKPFEFDELESRIKALLKRSNIKTSKKIIINNTTLNFDDLTISNSINKISLSKKEFSILFKLLSYPERTFTKDQLFDEFWGLDNDVDVDAVKVYISKIRSQISLFKDIGIETVRGIGYRGIKNEK